MLATLALASPALAVPITYGATLLGTNEIPVVNTPGSGVAFVTFDLAAHTMLVNATFANLLGPTMAAHVHCCVPQPAQAGVATQTPTFANLPLGVTSGSFTQLLDTSLASSWNPAFITANGGSVAAAEAAFAFGLANNMTYFNIHTAAPLGFPGGEIRGVLSTVPEPATLTLLGLGLGATAAVRRRRSKRS